MSENSALNRVKDYLLDGNTLSGIEALELFGVYRLSSLIHRLRKQGYIIVTEERATSGGKVYGEYRLTGRTERLRT
ncbi:helix-turn-helix domain-containing protein [Pyramidobacter piscolens]|uniref:helix-turn-helix domain-containing protein n=1 Tax=Pyramidobacter piscolens TaxID=638849 RepID=UPI003AB8B7DA